MKVPKDVAEATPIIRRRCIADVYNNENEIKHRCQRAAKEDSKHCWQHERGFRGVVRRRAS